MSMTDSIADMITRIRNALMANHSEVLIPKSKLKVEIAKILLQEGYIEDFSEPKEKDENSRYFCIKLKYTDRKPVIRGIQKHSKPGRRIYVDRERILPVANGFGTLILTTSKGVMTGYDAKKQGFGGEVLIRVW